MKKKSLKGFTLIELMIVVAILGVIASIAVPSYIEHVRKGKRADAKVELLRLAQMQESYFVQNLSYARDFTTGAGGLGLGATVTSEQDEYTMTIASTPAGCTGTTATPCTSYTLTATAGTVQSKDLACKDFTLSNTGVRGVTGAHSATPNDCW